MVGKDNFWKQAEWYLSLFINDSYTNCFAKSFLNQDVMNKSSLGYPWTKKGNQVI